MEEAIQNILVVLFAALTAKSFALLAGVINDLYVTRGMESKTVTRNYLKSNFCEYLFATVCGAGATIVIAMVDKL